MKPDNLDNSLYFLSDNTSWR